MVKLQNTTRNLATITVQQLIHPMPVVADREISRTPMQWRAKNAKCAPPDLVKSTHTQFCVFPRTPQTCQYEPASSSLGVSRELHLTLFPQGQSRQGLASQKLKCNYENKQQN